MVSCSLSSPPTEYNLVLNVLSIDYSYSFLLAVAELGGEDRAVWQHVRGRGQPRHHRSAAAPGEHHHPPWEGARRPRLHLQGLPRPGAYHSPQANGAATVATLPQ